MRRKRPCAKPPKLQRRSPAKQHQIAGRPIDIRAVAAVLRDWRSRRTAHASEQLPNTSPTQAIREMRDGIPTIALRHIRARLRFSQAAANYCAKVLNAQAADLDADVAATFRTCVGSEISQQIGHIDKLLADARVVSAAP